MKAKPIKKTKLNLEAELQLMRHREVLFEATEQAAQIGHFEWNYQQNRLESCSEQYARLFNMTVKQVIESQSSWDKTVEQIHPDDRERYRKNADILRESKALDVKYRIRLDDGEIRHIHEIAIVIESNEGVETGFFGILQDVTEQVKHERDLEYRDELARQAESITDIGHFIFDEQNEKYLYISDGFARIYGTAVEAYTSRMSSTEEDLSDIFKDDRDMVAQQYRNYIETGKDCSIEFRIWRGDGKLRWIRELGKAHLRQNGRVMQTIGVVQDITQRVEYEQELLFKDELANQAEAITDIGHFIFDEIRQKYLIISPGLARIHGLDPAQLIDGLSSVKRDLESIHVDDRNRVQKIYDEFLASSEEWQVEYRLVRADGQIRWVRELGKVHLMNHGIAEQTMGVLQDITSQKNAEQAIVRARDTLEQQVVERTRELANTIKQLQQEIEEREKIAAELDFLANHDALTGLPSLRLCKDRLDRSLAEARRNRHMSAVMFLDLDGFKVINDTYGHDFGDLVLKVTADRIKAEIRETDTVARIGGDEFVIILSSLPEIDIANRIAANLIDQISQTIHIERNQVSVSASIGIALYPEDGTTSEELIRTADKAMYLIKHAGKNSFGFVRSSQLN